MNVLTGMWRSFPKEMRLLILECVSEYQEEQRKQAKEKATCGNR
jgi:TRAP-type C4-dicarboxylate transport system substrate-binding protein